MNCVLSKDVSTIIFNDQKPSALGTVTVLGGKSSQRAVLVMPTQSAQA